MSTWQRMREGTDSQSCSGDHDDHHEEESLQFTAKGRETEITSETRFSVTRERNVRLLLFSLLAYTTYLLSVALKEEY